MLSSAPPCAAQDVTDCVCAMFLSTCCCSVLLVSCVCFLRAGASVAEMEEGATTARRGGREVSIEEVRSEEVCGVVGVSSCAPLPSVRRNDSQGTQSEALADSAHCRGRCDSGARPQRTDTERRDFHHRRAAACCLILRERVSDTCF